jgi:V-type H+-transporting ATPase subunit d
LEEETDYGLYLQNETGDVTTLSIRAALKQKLADDVEYLERNSVEPLTQIFFYIRTVFMIENLVNVIQGLRNNYPIEKIQANYDPLGYFPELKLIKLEADDYANLYKGVLIDTPISKYFLKYLEINTSEMKDLTAINAFFKETNNENLRACLKRLWMEDFYEFTQTLNDISKETFHELLSMEADLKTLQVSHLDEGRLQLVRPDQSQQREAQEAGLSHLRRPVPGQLQGADRRRELRDTHPLLREVTNRETGP